VEEGMLLRHTRVLNSCASVLVILNLGVG
jgi:hypothetical protein